MQQICNSFNYSSINKTLISSITPLGYQKPESSSPGPFFSTEMFRGADTNSEVEGDNGFDEEFFKKEIRKHLCK